MQIIRKGQKGLPKAKEHLVNIKDLEESNHRG